MRFLWLQALTAKHTERKLAGVVATLVSLATLIIMIWSTNFAAHDEELSLVTDNDEIAIPQVKANSIAEQNPSTNEVPPAHQAPQQSTLKAPLARTIPEQPSIQPQLAEKKVHTPASPEKHRIVIGRGHLYVQVGAYQQQKLARLMFEKMKRKYKRATIVVKSGLHAVLVGPVATRDEVERLKKRLIRLDNLKGFIVKE